MILHTVQRVGRSRVRYYAFNREGRFLWMREATATAQIEPPIAIRDWDIVTADVSDEQLAKAFQDALEQAGPPPDADADNTQEKAPQSVETEGLSSSDH